MQESKLDNFLENQKPIMSTWPKVAISITLLVIIFVSGVVALQSTNEFMSDYLINLSAGSIGSLITVFLIDYLISVERKLKLTAINKSSHYGLLIRVRRTMVEIMYRHGFILKKDRFSTLDNAEDKFVEFMSSPSLNKRLENLSKLTKTTMQYLILTNKILDREMTSILKGLDEIKPFPDPILKYQISTERAYGAGSVSVGQDLLKFYFNQLPKKINDHEIEKMRPGMDVLWKVVTDGLNTPRKNYKEYYLRCYKLLLLIAERAKKENVFLDPY